MRLSYGLTVLHTGPSDRLIYWGEGTLWRKKEEKLVETATFVILFYFFHSKTSSIWLLRQLQYWKMSRSAPIWTQLVFDPNQFDFISK